ncbi:MAG: DUF11 domain-containing protein [Dehalococcoidia bacterium]|nr:MAG: DUF11 domain-containing protein [Dehalococcoidia bacterium]
MRGETGKVLLITILCVAAIVLPPFLIPSPTYAVCPGTVSLDVSICAAPNILVDANKPGEEGPMVATVCATISNGGTGTAEDVYAYIGDWTTTPNPTPGSFPLGTDGNTLTMLGSTSDATRYIGDLGPSESKTVFWLVAYPATFEEDYQFYVWVDNEEECSAQASHTFRTRSAITAAANRLLGTIAVTPAGPVNPGHIVKVRVTGFNFGNVGDGPNNEEDAWMQPVGNLGFDPDCFRLIRTETSISSIDPPYTMPYQDRLYFTGIKSIDLNAEPDYDSDPDDYVDYYFIALKPCSTIVKPYQEVASGQEEKYSRDYCDEDATILLTSVAGGINLSKDVDPDEVEAGGTLTWTIYYGNTSDEPIGDPATGNGLVVVEEGIPEYTTYVADSAGCSDDCTIFYSTDNGATWMTTEPAAGDVTNIKWHIDDAIPENTDADTNPAGSVWFDTEVDSELPDTDGHPICNIASARINDSVPLTVDTVCANATPPQAHIEATKVDSVFNDVAPSGPSPGDTLLYQITITNESEDVTASNVNYHDILGPNLSLVPGSVTVDPSGPSVTYLDNSFEVDIGTIAASGSVDITFKAEIDSPLPEGVTQVANQGLVEGDNFPSEPTDDPDTEPDDDPTITLVTAAPQVEAYKTDSLFLDADSNGVASPGDTIEYTITITNNGNQNGAATVFIDPLDEHTTLVIGSVTTSQGTVIEGNGPGDTFVQVSLGTLAGNGGTATVSFRVTINSPLPTDVDKIYDQGVVYGSNFPGEPTDDPDTPADDDATETLLTLSPDVEAYKEACLCIDADNNGYPSPDDTITYTITIINLGNQEAGGVVFTDSPDANTTLVVGSVGTTQGSIIHGNDTGDEYVEVCLCEIPGNGGSAEVSFSVTIDSNGFSQVANQGQISGVNFDTEPTDDPGTPADDDPTITPVTAEPLIEAFKTDILVDDADSNGIVSSGDTLEYVIDIVNNGNATATGVTFFDTPDPNTTLVVGSVSASPGLVIISGNSPGDTFVEVDVGSLGPGNSVTVVFQVVIQYNGFSQVSNQGLAVGDNFPDEPTDDPETTDDDDATITPATSVAAPVPVRPAPIRRAAPVVGGEARPPDKLGVLFWLIRPALIAIAVTVGVALVIRRHRQVAKE